MTAVTASRRSGRSAPGSRSPRRRTVTARGDARSISAPGVAMREILLEAGGLQMGLSLGRPLEEELRAELVGVGVVRERLGRREVGELRNRRLDVAPHERS